MAEGEGGEGTGHGSGGGGGVGLGAGGGPSVRGGPSSGATRLTDSSSSKDSQACQC